MTVYLAQTTGPDHYLDRIRQFLNARGISTGGLEQRMGCDELITYIDERVEHATFDHYLLIEFTWFREKAWLDHTTDLSKVGDDWTTTRLQQDHHWEYWEKYIAPLAPETLSAKQARFVKNNAGSWKPEFSPEQQKSLEAYIATIPCNTK